MDSLSPHGPEVEYLADLLPKITSGRLAGLICGGIGAGIVCIIPFFIFWECIVPQILKARRNRLREKIAANAAKSPDPKVGSEILANAYARPTLGPFAFIKSLFGVNVLQTKKQKTPIVLPDAQPRVCAVVPANTVSVVPLAPTITQPQQIPQQPLTTQNAVPVIPCPVIQNVTPTPPINNIQAYSPRT